MKSPFTKTFFPLLKNRAVALVIVLVLLVLMAVLIVAFYSSVKTELVSANSYASGADARNLGDSAVQIAQAQIAAATQGGTTAQPLLWASQPGMIRTWTTNATGTAGSFYKLYSSSAMVVPGTGFSMAAEAPPADWGIQTARFVDLNAAVLVPDATGSITANGTTCSARYPIMDPALAAPKNGSGSVEGFEIDGAPGYLAGTYPPAVDYNPAKDPNPAAMPVEWLYMLADGTVAKPMFDAAGKITGFGGLTAEKPTKTNPITSRLAFWTDDETAKINVNTACEGTFWDMPRASTRDEMALARNIPVQNEYQRVAGHPSGVSLSPVLGSLLPRPTDAVLNSINWTLEDNATTNAGYDQIKPYLALSPRINDISVGPPAPSPDPKTDNTSQGGTRRTTKSPVGESTARPVSLDAARLYTTVDDFLFSDSYSSGQRNRNNFGSTTANPTTPQNISRYRFLLTTTARADESTPFNTPKVAVWPLPMLNTDPDSSMVYKPTKNWRNAKDRLIVQASTIGSKSYFFQRENTASDGTTTPTTITADKLSSASKNFDYVHITRNREIYSYLQKLTTNGGGGLGAIPGFGGNFTDKWLTLGRDRVLTQIFDIIRSQVNILKFKSDTAFDTSIYKQNLDTPNPQFAFDPLKPGDPLAGKVGAKYIVPIEIPSGSTPTRGFGRYMTISEATLVFHTWKVKALPGPPAVPEKRFLRAILYFQPYTPSPQASTRFGGRIRVRGLEKLKLTNKAGTAPSLNFPADAIFRFDPGGTFGNVFGAFRPLNAFYAGNNSLLRPSDPPIGSPAVSYNEDTHYPLFSDALEMSTDPTNTDWETIRLTTTAEIQVDILSPVSPTAGNPATVTSDDLLQTINFEFPPTNDMAVAATPDNASAINLGGGLPGTIINEEDISRSVVFLGDKTQHRGDLRLLALSPVVPKEWFGPHPDYLEPMTIPAPAVNLDSSAYTNGRFAHSLRNDISRTAVLYPKLLDKGAGGKANSANTVGVDIPNRLSPNGDTAKKGGLAATVRISEKSQAVAPIKMAAAFGPGNIPGDWASSFGSNPDGSDITPIDMSMSIGWNYGGYIGDSTVGNQDNASLYEPTRMIPSAVSFGDLLTPDITGNLQGWQTLLFNPVPAADVLNNGTSFKNNLHAGAKNPPDHLLLELFWMPIVEPYALSEAFSTNGKINPNYQIAPFNYIHRSTALQGALKSIRIGAVPETDPAMSGANDYKDASSQNATSPPVDLKTSVSSMKTRHGLNLKRTDGTIRIFEDFFTNGDNVLRTASEVCTLPLIPQNETKNSLATFWNTYRLTSDTLRESPYKQLYSRLTTKSNTYTVHYRVQALTQTPKSVAAGTWEEGKDAVRAEYRGATTIERYIDPNTPGLPDYATDPSPAPLSNFARFRTLSNRQFTP